MKKRYCKIIISIMLTLVTTPVLFSLDKDAFDKFNKIVDFSTTIKTLNTGASLQDKLFILNGTISNISFINAKKDDFKIEAEIVTGEWAGLESVTIYKCTVVFEGPEYYKIFPKRMPKNPGPEVIGLNNLILIVVKAVKPITAEDGTSSWLLQGLHVRRIH